ncbi:uncharacterized protein [Eurosta solidaginis]|uniref:uncharacterized protein n=1 Tax=Eurosta solidaginis TaxID=178769 RepID=UPI003531574A
MFTSSTRHIICLVVTLQAISFAAAQLYQLTDETGAFNVSTKADDYINQNRRQYNATLQNFLDQIADINTSLENQVTSLDKQKELLLKQIKETNERLQPLEGLNAQAEFCVQKYEAELPYADIVKANIESCFATARGSYAGIVSQLNVLYSNLLNYYNADFRNALLTCSRTFPNPSINYTNCILPVISRTNTVTNNQRTSFVTTFQTANCALTARIDATVSCSYAFYNSALVSLGAAERLINDCISGVSASKPCIPVTAGCSIVKNVRVNETTDFTNVNITNLLVGLSKAQGCVELRYL